MIVVILFFIMNYGTQMFNNNLNGLKQLYPMAVSNGWNFLAIEQKKLILTIFYIFIIVMATTAIINQYKWAQNWTRNRVCKESNPDF